MCGQTLGLINVFKNVKTLRNLNAGINIIFHVQGRALIIVNHAKAILMFFYVIDCCF